MEKISLQDRAKGIQPTSLNSRYFLFSIFENEGSPDTNEKYSWELLIPKNARAKGICCC